MPAPRHGPRCVLSVKTNELRMLHCTAQLNSGPNVQTKSRAAVTTSLIWCPVYSGKLSARCNAKATHCHTRHRQAGRSLAATEFRRS
jgi:hypothetical protein